MAVIAAAVVTAAVIAAVIADAVVTVDAADARAVGPVDASNGVPVAARGMTAVITADVPARRAVRN